jgi:hypothetical protein
MSFAARVDVIYEDFDLDEKKYFFKQYHDKFIATDKIHKLSPTITK